MRPASSSLAVLALAALAPATLGLGACQKASEPAKAPAERVRVPVVVEPSAPRAAPGAELPPGLPTTEAPPAPAPPPPAPPPEASPFKGAFDLVGTEPFWSLKIRDEALTLQRPDHADLSAPNPGFDEFGATAMWNVTAGQSHMTVTVTKADCTDGMSDRTYPYAAKVTIWGTTLSGCASRPRS